ncbi:MAG TPA: DPP IV N-terminal domain-containing protein, partial [Candidatus Acidoferrales bacterium]|nr:DPP IV N-terminal domain-containing protein [Candidatus Acidoferrales bacterium]
MLAALTLVQLLSYPFPAAPARDLHGTAIAYTLDTQGVRTLWFARAPGFAPQQLFSSGTDDGQELTNVNVAGDDAHVVYVRGGDHDANWPLPLQPNPASNPTQPDMQVWSVSTQGGASKLLGGGDAPAISPDGKRVAFTNDGAVMIAPIDGDAAAKRMFFDRGQDSDLRWSPDGSSLAFVSTRDGDHSFIGIYRNDATPIQYLAPSTSQDVMPRWSPDGTRIAFIRVPGDGGPPQNPLNWNLSPWEIWVADASSGSGRRVWTSPNTLRGSLPQTGGGPLLEWVAGDRLVFNSEQDNWPHLYAVSANGGAARLLTPGAFMVEDVSVAPDLRSVVYSANTGSTPGDDDRRHVYRVDVETGGVTQLASGASSEFGPVALAGDAVAFNRATAQQPPLVTLLAGGAQRPLDATLLPANFPSSQLVTPREVAFTSADGTLVHGQLFVPRGGGKHPGIIFV